MDNSIIVPPPGTKLQKKWKSKAKGLQKDVLLMQPIEKHYNPKEENPVKYLKKKREKGNKKNANKDLKTNTLEPLGNSVEFSATFADSVTNESIGFQKLLWDLKTQSGITLSSLEQFTTQNIIYKEHGTDGKVKHIKIGKKEKVCSVLECGVKPIPIKKNSHIDYVQGEKGKRYFANIQHCGLGWVCPVCNYKIQTEKTKQLNEALLQYTQKGYVVYFGAVTLPHYQSEALEDNLKTLLDGWNWVKSHRTVKKEIRSRIEKFPIVDFKTGEVLKTIKNKPDFWYVRSLEITYGKNGFHPHLHPIFILRKEDAENYLKAFKDKYLDWLKKNDKDNQHTEQRAFMYEEWDGSFEKLTEYVNKTKIKEGISDEKAELIYNIKKENSRKKLADELTRGQNKKSREGVTPWEMLLYIKEKTKFRFSRSPKELFREYAEATKGKSMLQTCQYFYQYIGLDELEEAEILKDDKTEKVLFSIEKPLWKKLAKENLIYSVKELYERGQLKGYGILAVEDFLKEKGIKFERNITIFNDA